MCNTLGYFNPSNASFRFFRTFPREYGAVTDKVPPPKSSFVNAPDFSKM